MSIAAASLVLGGIGTGISTLGALSQGQSQSAEAAYQAQVASNNQLVAQQYATSANEAGEVAAETQSQQARAVVASEVATAGASGIDPRSGSARQTQQSQRLVGRLNAATAQQQGQMQAYGYEAQATNLGAQAGLFTAQSQAAEQAGLIGAGASLLGGLSNVGSKYAWMKATGALPGAGATVSPFAPSSGFDATTGVGAANPFLSFAGAD